MYICQVTTLRCGVVAAPSRQRNPRGEGERLREQLLEATVEVLGEVGDADRVSVRAIARRAGVSPTALYLQFPDRDALVDAAVDEGFAPSTPSSTRRRRAPAPARAPGGDGHRLPGVLRAPARALRDPLLRPPAMLERPAVPRQRGFDGLVALLRQVDPTLDADDARQLALLIWSSLHGYAMLRVARPHFDWPDAETYIRRLLVAHHL